MPPKTLRVKSLVDGSVPEKVIQKAILKWLTETNILHWRQNSGTVFAGGRVIRLGEEGLPDIVCVIPPNGHFLGLEVKSAKGKIRPAQAEFADRIRSIGGSYVVVRTLEQAMRAVALTLGEQKCSSRSKDPFTLS